MNGPVCAANSSSRAKSAGGPGGPRPEKDPRRLLERWFMMKRSPAGCLWAAFFLVVACFSCGGPRTVMEKPVTEEPAPPAVRTVPSFDFAPVVRVLLLGPSSRVRVRVTSGFLLGENHEGPAVSRFDRGGDFTVTLSETGLRLAAGGKRIHEASGLFIKPLERKGVYINGKPYRGGFWFEASHEGFITVNILEVDDYIKGVLPAEMGYLRPDQFEAYCAQAVASRSYALSKLEEKKSELYDLQATIMDQVYRGTQGESPEASRAVDETRGLVGIWESEPIRAYYSSCCGGHTSDIRNAWPWKTPYPYLYGVRDALPQKSKVSLCRGSGHFRWKHRWGAGRLRSVLRKTLPLELGVRPRAVGELQDIRVLETSSDGRAAVLEIVTDRGRYRIEGDRIRWVLKPDPASDAILRSTLFKMEVKTVRGRVSTVIVKGGGNGHGVGMCQTGAIGMAELGFSGEEILRHYYPGIKIMRLY